MIASAVYIPPPGATPYAKAFVENLKKFQPVHKLIILSDYDYKKDFPKADYTFLQYSPEKLEAKRLNPTSGVSNALFVASLRAAKAKNIKHMLYLEADCRVGQIAWDETVFNEYFDIGFPVVAAGTLMAWNIFNGGKVWVREYKDLVKRTIDFPTPVHAYGSFPTDGPHARPFNPTIFPNGAGMVVNVSWAWELFNGFDNMMSIAIGEGMEGKAWDWQIGERVRKKFGDQSMQLFGHLKSVCSCYGNLTMTEDERLDLLRAGKVAISHQHKGDKTV